MKQHQKKTVDIKCRGAGVISIDLMNPLQGDLKILIDENYERLKAGILEEGFIEPISIWEDTESAKIYVLNGHQRLEVLRRMKVEGFLIPQIPVNYVEAESLVDAKKKILSLASQFGTVSSVGLKNYLEELEISAEVFESRYSFPEIDISAMLSNVEPMNFLIDGAPESNPIVAKNTAPAAPIVLGEEDDDDDDDDEVVTHSIFPKAEVDADAFRYFRQAGFPYPKLTLHEQKQELNRLATLEGSKLLKSRLGYRVADTYHPHRFAAAAHKMRSPVDAFKDDKCLKKAIAWHTEASAIGTDLWGELTLVNGTQACSNFRPAFARYIYELYCNPGGVVFDSSTGYGGRLVGFLASTLGGYIGTDPNVPTFEANKLIAKTLGGHKKVTLFNKPIEDLDVSKLQKSCDLAFTSPPYFVKEIYSQDKTQSCQRYQKIDQWLDGFLTPMLKKQFVVLKKKRFAVVNIEDVTVDNVKHPLVEQTIERAKDVGFRYVETKLFELSMRTMVVDGEKVSRPATESVLIFEKP